MEKSASQLLHTVSPLAVKPRIVPSTSWETSVTVLYQMARTDISLVQPVQAPTYLPEPFADSTSESLDGSLTFRSLLDPSDVNIGIPVHTNTPFNEPAEGILMAVKLDVIPNDQDKDEIVRASFMMTYFGNGSEGMADGDMVATASETGTPIRVFSSIGFIKMKRGQRSALLSIL